MQILTEYPAISVWIERIVFPCRLAIVLAGHTAKQVLGRTHAPSLGRFAFEGKVDVHKSKNPIGSHSNWRPLTGKRVGLIRKRTQAQHKAKNGNDIDSPIQ